MRYNFNIIIASVIAISPISGAAAQDQPIEHAPEYCNDIPAETLLIAGQIFKRGDVTDVKSFLDDIFGHVILITWSDTGRERFIEAQHDMIGEILPICYGSRLLMSPVLYEEVAGNDVQISGGFEQNEAKKISMQLRDILLPLSDSNEDNSKLNEQQN